MQHRGLWPDAVAHWTRALEIEPIPLAFANLAACLRAIGDLETATATVDKALPAFPDDVLLLTEAGHLALARGDYAIAVDLWKKTIACPEPLAACLQGHAQALVLAGRLDEAEPALASARAAHPDHFGLLLVEGMLLTGRELWPEALAFWSALLQSHPDEQVALVQLAIVRHALELDRATEDGGCHRATPLDLPRPHVAGDDLSDLMLQFESIGETCEFGLVQRHFRAEPIGLLRWNLAPYDRLLEAVVNRFEGMGDERNTAISLSETNEFYVTDRRWHLGMHTLHYDGQIDREVLRARMCRRIAFLKDKFLADLAEGKKILVVRATWLSDDKLATLQRALDALGPTKLLAVCSASRSGAGAPVGVPGHVEAFAPRRLVGFLSGDSFDRNGHWNIPFDEWAAICRKAVSLA